MSADVNVPAGPGDVAVPGHQREARLVPDHAAVVGRHADRSADVAAQLDRREPHRQRGRGAAR